jgi:hypothetical protein
LESLKKEKNTAKENCSTLAKNSITKARGLTANARARAKNMTTKATFNTTGNGKTVEDMDKENTTIEPENYDMKESGKMICITVAESITTHLAPLLMMVYLIKVAGT